MKENEKLLKFMKSKYLTWEEPRIFQVIGMEVVKTQRGIDAVEYTILTEEGEEKKFTSASKKLARLLFKIGNKKVKVERTGESPNVNWNVKLLEDKEEEKEEKEKEEKEDKEDEENEEDEEEIDISQIPF